MDGGSIDHRAKTVEQETCLNTLKRYSKILLYYRFLHVYKWHVSPSPSKKLGMRKKRDEYNAAIKSARVMQVDGSLDEALLS